jgi:TetR/AcrR family transcriptional repressor of nem operon
MNTITTRDKILELGRVLIQTYGYNSFKYLQIATELGIKNAAIHHYFPSKEDLGLAVIEKIHADFLLMTKKTILLSANEKADILLNMYRGYILEGLNLCIIGVCISAYVELPDRMKIAAKNLYNDLIQWLIISFEDGLSTDTFRFVGSAEDLAKHYLVIMAGSIQMAKMNGIDDFDKSVARLKLLYVK